MPPGATANPMNVERPRHPRIAPMQAAELTPGQRSFVQAGASNVILTLVRHEDLLKAWLGLGEKLLLRSRLSPRERELIVLRVALQTDAEYEWANHVPAAFAAGIREDEVRALVDNISGVWSETEGALLDAVDELCADNCVSDSTWVRLRATRDESQLLELLMLIGFYRMNAGLLNSTGVSIEPGRPRLREVPTRTVAARPMLTPDAGADPATVGGAWRVTFHHPAGEQQLRLLLEVVDGAVTGSVANPSLGVTVPIVSGTVTGNRFSFVAPLTSPVHVEIGYDGAVTGTAISGEITVGGAGAFPFDGSRE
jgi:4-carboxymuconolactone decarboxylase